jgi:leucyl-tRNA synthetase
MIFSGLEHMNEKPFSKVFIHGLVRDAQGRKMSKSLGNGIDPLKVIEEYGADALRFALATGNAPGNDMRFSDEKIESARNFANKLWNASRFVLMNLTEEDGELLTLPLDEELAIEDKWILSRFNKLTKTVNGVKGVAVKWEKVAGAAKYRVYRKTSKTGWKSVGVTSKTSFFDKTAKKGVAYQYSVATVTADGTSRTSDSSKTGISAYFMPKPAIASVERVSSDKLRVT